MDDTSGERTIEYGVVAVDVMASMSGLDFVRAIFARQLPEPPIMQTVEPFDCTAEPGVVVIHSVPGLRHYNPIGSVHGGYAAILLDSADGARGAEHATGGRRLYHAGIQDLIGARHERDERRGPNRGPRAQRRPPRRQWLKRASLMQKTGNCACDDDVPCVRDCEGESENLTLNFTVGKVTCPL